MLPRSLTPEEVASLLESTMSLRANPGERPTPPRASVDSTGAQRIELAARLRQFGELHARLEARLAAALERRPSDSVTVQWLECDSLPFGQLLWTMPPPTCVGMLQRERQGTRLTDATLAIHLNLDLLYALLDRLLMGNGTLAADLRRPLTEVEQRLALRIIRPLIEVWHGTLRDRLTAGETWRIEQVLSHPQRLAGWSAETPLVVNRYRVTVENRTGLLQFVAPTAALEEWLAESAAVQTTTNRPSEWTVQVADQSLATVDVADLQVGDILQTDHPLSHPLLAQSDTGEWLPVRIGPLDGQLHVKKAVDP